MLQEVKNSSAIARALQRNAVTRTISRPEFGALIGALVVYAFFASTTVGSGFVGVAGSAGWINTASELGIVAIPVAMLMIAGEFDLSVGATLGSTTMLVSIGSSHYGWPLWVSILAAIAFAIMVGLANAFVTMKIGVPSFIATLAVSLGLEGLTLALSRIITGTTVVSLRPSGAFNSIFAGQWHQLHISIVWWLVLAAFGAVALGKARFGNWVYATGGSEKSAREAGVPTMRVKTTLFVSSALGAALVGVIQTFEFGGGDVGRGQSYVFNSIIAAVIGGILLTGGYGTILGVVLGSATYGIVTIGFFYTGWDADWAELLLGVLLLLAVVANNFTRGRTIRAGGEPEDDPDPAYAQGSPEDLVATLTVDVADRTVPVLALDSVTKRFADTTAISDITLRVYPGEVLCLLGDNGAGKSTLIKILSGVHVPTTGTVLIDGVPTNLSNPRDARAQGIATVHQDTGTLPLMSVARNFFLGAEPQRRVVGLSLLDFRRAAKIAVDEVRALGIRRVRKGTQLVGTLSGGERQALAIARATHFGARVLILDEPTSALGVKESAYVLRLVDAVRQRGVGVVLITHNAQHALAIADHIAVLIHGKLADYFPNGERTRDEVLNLMAGGEEIAELELGIRRPAPVAHHVERLSDDVVTIPQV